jgi:hypothetical protein
MNLYGWSVQSFHDVLGSNDQGVLEAAMIHLADFLKDEPALARGNAWLRTLIEAGYPLRQDRPPQSEPADGGLLTVSMETETHVLVVHSIATAIRREAFLDLSGESSFWAHPAVTAVSRELSACGFTRSKACHTEYFGAMATLSKGSPLFGDDFRTGWSYYSVLTRPELTVLILILQAATDFTSPAAEGHPDESAKAMKTGLSATGKQFLGDLIGWFSQIEAAGQDAYIIWW